MFRVFRRGGSTSLPSPSASIICRPARSPRSPGLSGGERQKLSIARAILRHSDLIIFDEATTYLDESSVASLREVIQKRFADKTCLVISHRPIEIPVIDRVYWIEGGSVREQEKQSLTLA